MFPNTRFRGMRLMVLIFSGLSLCLSTNIFKEYHFIKMLKTWAEAQKYCRENFHDLAAVENLNENQKLLRTLPKQELRVWIGLQENMTRWKWTKGNEDFYNGVDFSNWAKGQPNRRQDSCVGILSSGLWQDEPCGRLYPAVCFNERGPPKFILEEAKTNWFEAQNYCQSRYTGLATVTNQSENNEIKDLLSTKTWIGLFKFFWTVWSDQTQVTFENWHSKHPTTSGWSGVSCGVVNTTTGRWWNFGCEKRYNFVCQRRSYAKNTARFSLKFQSEADFNDPIIQQQILKQLQEKLESRGLSNFTLGWSKTDGKVFHKEQKKKEESGC